MTFTEIAETLPRLSSLGKPTGEMGVTPATVKTIADRALRKLKHPSRKLKKYAPYAPDDIESDNL